MAPLPSSCVLEPVPCSCPSDLYVHQLSVLGLLHQGLEGLGLVLTPAPGDAQPLPSRCPWDQHAAAMRAQEATSLAQVLLRFSRQVQIFLPVLLAPKSVYLSCFFAVPADMLILGGRDFCSRCSPLTSAEHQLVVGGFHPHLRCWI